MPILHRFQATLLRANKTQSVEPEKAKPKFGISYDVEGDELGSRRYHVDLYGVDKSATKVSVELDRLGFDVTVTQGEQTIQHSIQHSSRLKRLSG